MSDILEDLKAKQNKIQELQRKEERRRGQEEQVMKSAKEKFGVSSLEEAQTKLKEVSGKIDQDEKQLQDLDSELGEILTKAGGSTNVGSV
jgi:hypothetical protein